MAVGEASAVEELLSAGGGGRESAGRVFEEERSVRRVYAGVQGDVVGAVREEAHRGEFRAGAPV